MAALVIASWVVLATVDDPACGIPADVRDAQTRPVGCPPIDDREAAARVDLTRRESRPANARANRTRPTAEDLEWFRATNDYVPEEYAARVTGAFTGTTDDIIEWAAWKWGIDEDLLRAQALQESDWLSSARGDGGVSIGVMQIKRTVHLGTFPMTARSTAFNLDYYGAVFRHYYDGRATWLNRVERGEPYRAGDVWGSVGAHFAGRWRTPEAEDYIADVRRQLRERRWRGG